MSWAELAARGALCAFMWVMLLLIGSHRKRLARLERQQKYMLELYELELGGRGVRSPVAVAGPCCAECPRCSMRTSSRTVSAAGSVWFCLRCRENFADQKGSSRS